MPKTEDMTEDEQGRLRDEFAMAALMGILAQIRHATRYNSDPKEVSDAAFAYADAMLEARDRGRHE